MIHYYYYYTSCSQMQTVEVAQWSDSRISNPATEDPGFDPLAGQGEKQVFCLGIDVSHFNVALFD